MAILLCLKCVSNETYGEDNKQKYRDLFRATTKKYIVKNVKRK